MARATALITGGTAGIGLEIAGALAQRGMHVVLTGRDEQRGAAAATDVRRRAGHTGSSSSPSTTSPLAATGTLRSVWTAASIASTCS
jgi:NAD(P)-dependent dehydrogenase (short-subunit alcohol dehydrogenase family)